MAFEKPKYSLIGKQAIYAVDKKYFELMQSGIDAGKKMSESIWGLDFDPMGQQEAAQDFDNVFEKLQGEDNG